MKNFSEKKCATESIPNDAEFVEVSSPAHRSERLFESDDNGSNVVTVPSGAKQNVAKPANKQVSNRIIHRIAML